MGLNSSIPPFVYVRRSITIDRKQHRINYIVRSRNMQLHLMDISDDGFIWQPAGDGLISAGTLYDINQTKHERPVLSVEP